jgi:uncharacterized coiled-coil DUF342 family protein
MNESKQDRLPTHDRNALALARADIQRLTAERDAAINRAAELRVMATESEFRRVKLVEELAAVRAELATTTRPGPALTAWAQEMRTRPTPPTAAEWALLRAVEVAG